MADRSFKIRNWRKFQMYKDRNPTWICVHVALLDDLDWEDIPDDEKWHIVAIWLLAADRDHPRDEGFEDGPALRYDPAWIQKKCSLKKKPDLDKLVKLGFISCYESVTNPLRSRYDTVPSETETETETDSMSGKPDVATEVIEILNDITGSSFSTKTEATRKKIRGRLKEGHTVDDFRRVIQSKFDEWKHDDKMKKFLRPATLFGPEKFDSYLQAATPAKKEPKWFVPPVQKIPTDEEMAAIRALNPFENGDQS